MVALYKGLTTTYGLVSLKPGTKHSIRAVRKIFSKGWDIWLSVDGMVEIPYTLEELYAKWEPVEE